MKKIVIIFLVLVVTSCVKREDVRIISLEDYNITGFTGVELFLKAQNSSGKEIRVSGGEFTVMRNGRKFADVRLKEDVILHRRSVEVVRIPLALKLRDPLAAIELSMTRDIDPAQFSLYGQFKVTVGKVTRNVKVEERSLSSFARSLGLTDKQLLNL